MTNLGYLTTLRFMGYYIKIHGTLLSFSYNTFDN